MPEPRKRVAQQQEGFVQRFRSLAFGGPFTARGGGPVPVSRATAFATHYEERSYRGPAFFQHAPPARGSQLTAPVSPATPTAPQTPAQLFQTGVLFGTHRKTAGRGSQVSAGALAAPPPAPHE